MTPRRHARRSARRPGWRRRSGSRSRASSGTGASRRGPPISGAKMMPRWPFRPRMIGRAALPTSSVIGDGEPGDVERAADQRQARIAIGDEVEHDRGDDLVGARDRLEDARDEAPDRRRRASRRASASGIATIGGVSRSWTPTMTAPSAPIRNWPWAPMLNRPALNAEADRQAAEDERRRASRAC